MKTFLSSPVCLTNTVSACLITSPVSDSTGWRPVVAAYKWWPFAFCTRNYAFVATQIWPVYQRKQKKHLQRKIDQIFCLGGKRQAILPTYSHSNTIAVPGDDSLSNTNNQIEK